jgi:antirestriction protein ArdC
MSDDKHYNQLTDRIIALMEAGNLPPWLKGWEAGHAPTGPWNPASGHTYSGENVYTLLFAQEDRGLEDASWMTYNQARAVGAQVMKGAKSVRVKKYLVRTEEEKQAMLARDPQANTRPLTTYAWVFSTSEISGLPPELLAPKCKLNEIERHEACERLLAASGVTVKHDKDQAYYRPSTDTIHMPPRGAFQSADFYYATALHELAHATGHPKRLHRESLAKGLWGTPEYAREELVAETASYFMGQRLGIGHDPGNHAAYLKFWINELKSDNKLMSRAASQAAEVCKYLGITAELIQVQPLQRVQQQTKDQHQEEDQEQGQEMAA